MATLGGMFKSWKFLLVAVALMVVLFTLAWQQRIQKATKNGLRGTLTSRVLKVSSASMQSLSSKTLATDTPPTTVSNNLQTQPNNLDQASTFSLQSNTNINDPMVQNNPLVKSLLSGGAQ